MSSEVMTHPTWKRLHVALLVSDMVKSMIRLSRLGRSIFPINWPPGRKRRNPALALRFRNFGRCGLPTSQVRCKIYFVVWQDERKGSRLLIRAAPFGTLSLEVRDPVEGQGEALIRFLEVGAVRESFAAGWRDGLYYGLRS